MKDTYYIGLDAHKESIAIAYAIGGSRAKAVYHGGCGGSLPATENALRKLAKKLGVKFRDLKVCYEAGPTGFVLARRLIKLGLECVVMAPTKSNRKPNEKIKTDKRDAMKIAREFRNGDIVEVRIPPSNDQAIRDVARARTDASDDLSRSKQRLKSFLLCNGHRYSGSATWGGPHMNYLRGLSLGNPAQQIVLEEYLLAIEHCRLRLDRLIEKMEELLVDWEWKPVVEALMAFKGFKIVAAMTIISELGDLRRFEGPKSLMSFLGLVPGEHSTGGKRHQGAITKCGNSHARWMLIESAQHYRKEPNVSPQLSQRQEGQPVEVRELSWRAQHRLHNKYVRLKARKLKENKAIVAMARELSSFIWELQNKTTITMPPQQAA
jgi:transposase